MKGAASFAEGAVAVAEGNLEKGRICYEDAIDYLQEIKTPFECGRERVVPEHEDRRTTCVERLLENRRVRWRFSRCRGCVCSSDSGPSSLTGPLHREGGYHPFLIFAEKPLTIFPPMVTVLSNMNSVVLMIVIGITSPYFFPFIFPS